MSIMHNRWVSLRSGEEGAQVAEILGIDPARVHRDARIVIGVDDFAVAELKIKLTADQLLEIAELVAGED